MKQEDIIRMAREAGLCPVDDCITAIKAALAQPAQRPWVGLTDAEAQWIYDNCRTPAGMMEMVETKLKAKNT